MQVKRILICFFLYFLATHVALAEFDPVAANKKLDKITLSLSGTELTLSIINEASSNINELKKEAEKCVKENSDKLDEFNAQLPIVENQEDRTINSDQLKFLEKKRNIENTISECKLFILRVNESLQVYTNKSKQIKKNIILSPKKPIIHELPKLKESIGDSIDDFNITELKSISSFSTYSKNELIFLLGLSFLILLLAFFFKKNINSCLNVKTEKKSDLHILSFSLFRQILKRFDKLVLLLFLFCYTSFHDLHYDLDFLLNDIIFIGIMYLIVVSIIEFLVFPYKQNLSIFKVSRKTAKNLIRYTKFYFALLVVGMIGFTVLHLVENPSLLAVINAFYFLMLSLSFSFFVYYSVQVLSYISESAIIKKYILFFLILFIIMLNYLRWYGFEGLSTYILKGAMVTYIGVIISYLVYKMVAWLIDCFSANEGTQHLRLFKFFNFQKYEVLLEMIVLKLVFFVIIWGGYFVIVNDAWSFSDLWSIKIREMIFNGFTLANVNIVPARIVGGLCFFSLSILTVKILKNIFYFRDQDSFNAAEEAYVIILGYFGFALILIFSLLIGGVNLQGLAIIAGALSVGIGFGLQSIVNNFVSGLVLLLERPIKRGDRIIVGDKEGFVTDIGIRSTRINTLLQTDVIVPNAELVSNKVVNYMYNNKKARLTMYVEVEHCADPTLVKSLLFQAASANERVLQGNSDEPKVFFTGYTSSSLKFELWCTIDNVNFIYATKSDLYFQINILFRENDIKIAFQQIDLHIKKDNQNLLDNDE